VVDGEGDGRLEGGDAVAREIGGEEGVEARRELRVVALRSARREAGRVERRGEALLLEMDAAEVDRGAGGGDDGKRRQGEEDGDAAAARAARGARRRGEGRRGS